MHTESELRGVLRNPFCSSRVPGFLERNVLNGVGCGEENGREAIAGKRFNVNGGKVSMKARRASLQRSRSTTTRLSIRVGLRLAVTVVVAAP